MDRRLRVESLELRQLLAPITGGVGTGGFEPTTSSSALRLWLDSTDTSTLFADTTATTPVGDTGDSIARWNDKSGYELNVLQNDVNNRPVFVPADGKLNNQPTLSFRSNNNANSIDDALISPTGNATGITGNASRTVIAAWVNAGFTSINYQHAVHFGNATTNQSYGISTSRAGNAGSGIGNHYWGAGFDSSAQAGVNPNIAVAAWDGAADQWHVNGADVGASNRAALDTGAGELMIGSRIALGGSGPVEGMWGNIAEVLIYDRVLSDAERIITENALGAKYGIPVSEDHYAGDNASAGNYDLGVFGIGQDGNAGVVATAGTAGFGMEDLSSVEVNEYAFAGYRETDNGYVAHEVGRRWIRDWYVDVTGTISATLSFDHGDAGLADPGAGVTYSLLYSADGTDFQVVEGLSAPLIFEDRITFTVPDTVLQDGYYTLADDTTVEPAVVTASAGGASFEPGDLPRTIDTMLTVSDADSADLVGAKVSVSGNYNAGEDVLSFADQAGITGSFNRATGVLTLSGTASVGDYQAALRTVTYQNTAYVPSTATRTISFSVDDGDTVSDAATRNIEVSTRLVTGGYGPGGIEPTNGAESLRMWLDAADTSTLFTDPGGTTPVTSNGQAVARWNDKSGYGLNVQQASTGNTPSFALSVGNLNGQSSVSFVGGAGGDGLGAANATDIVNNDDRTLLTVFALTNLTGQPYQHVLQMGNPATDQSYGISASRATNAGSPIGNHYWNNGFNTAAKASANPNIAVAAWDGDGTTGGSDAWSVNGADVGVYYRKPLLTGPDQIQVGSRINPFTEGITGNVSEVMIYDRALNQAERAIVENHLSAKYNIAIANNHYDGDLAANGNHDADVFGIGRVDAGNQVASSGAAGLGLMDATGTLDDGEFLMAGHAAPDNGYASLPGGRRWLRAWYVDETGDIDVTMTFDHATAGLTPEPGATYTLLHSADGTTYSDVAGAVAQVAGQRVAFNLTADQLQDGYYTLGDDVAGAPPAIVTSAGALSYRVTDPAAVIDDALTVTDADNAELQGATVTISQGLAVGQDFLGFTDQLGLTGDYDQATGVLTISGTASLEDYQTALRSVTFFNETLSTSVASRTVIFRGFDGNSFSDESGARQIDVGLPPLTGGTGPGGFEVADGSGSLRMWLDSTDSSTLFTDSGGSTPVQNDGELVARWSDKSGYGLHVTQDGAANRPSFVSSVGNLNSQPAVGFVGGAGGDALSAATGNSTGISGNDDRTVVNVWASTGFTGQNYQHTFHMGNPSGNQAYGISASRAANEGSPIGNHYWGAGFDTLATAGNDPNIAVAAWDGDGGTAGNGLDQWHVNGNDVGAADIAPLNTGTDQLQIGSRLSPFTEGFSGNLTEVLIYDRVLNSAERTIVDNYLSSKYDIGVTDDRYEGDLPANGDHDHQVFGIGRDDDANQVLESGAGGLGFAAGSLDDGDYLLAGRNDADIGYQPVPAGRHWLRTWYLDVSGQVDATLTFDHSDAGIALPTGTTFQLYYSADGADFMPVAGVTATVMGDTVSFDLTGAQLVDGYYTLGDDMVLEPPAVTTSAGQVDYQATNPAVAIDDGLTVTDADDTQLQGAVVTIVSGFVPGQDVLGFAAQAGITGSYNSSTGELTLSGTADLADYEQALRSVTFANISGATSAGSRTILFQAFDGDVFSDDSATRDIAITPTVLAGGTGPGGIEFADGGDNLRLWLDSVDQSTIFSDAAGTTNVANSGDPVGRWNDKSGYGLHVTQGSLGNQPAYFGTVPDVNDQAVVSFNGGAGGDALTAAAGNATGITGNDDRTVINVWVSSGFTSQNYQHTFHMGDPTTDRAYGISASRAGNEGSPIGNHYWGSGFDTTATAGISPNIAVAAWDGDGGEAGIDGRDQWHVNGADVGFLDRAPLNTGASQLQIGSRLTPFTEGFSGNLTEVLVYDRVLNSAERSIVENHLSAKYNVPVQNDRYTGDDTANGDYDRDVFGIGRDDESNLVDAAGMAGFGIQDMASLDDGEYVLAGHRTPNNSVIDLPENGQRWERVWYVDKSGGIDAMFHFDFSSAGLPLPPAGDSYSLLYSASEGGPFTDLGLGAVVSVDSISFAVGDADMQTGYYTLGINVIVDAVAVAGGPYAIDEGQSLTLAGSANSGSFAFSWDLNGDGTFGDAMGATPTLTWSELQALGIDDGPSSFDVTLRVSDGMGNEDEDMTTLTVSNVAPTADAGGPYVIDEGSSLTLAGNAADPNDPLTVSWDLNGDGTFGDATGATPTLTWTQLQALGIDDGPGNFDVTLRVDDGQGGEATSMTTLTVDNVAPTANAGGPYAIDEGSSLTLAGAASDPNDPLTVSWDLNGDGTFGDATGATPTLSWAQLQALGIDDGPGNFDVTLRVDDGQGGEATSMTTLNVANVAPTANAGGPYQVTPGDSVTLSGTATDPAGAADPITFQWDLDGDGAFGETGAAAERGDETGPNPTFSAAGLNAPSQFQVGLIALDDDGGTSAVVMTTINVNTASAVFIDNDGNLVVQGTAGPDRVILYAGPRSTTLVRLNDARFGPFHVGDGARIIVSGDAGNDRITVSGNLSGVSELRGGSGGDYIAGGTNDDVMFGEDGNDILLGGEGNNTIDGGAGNDQIGTRGGDDVLRGGAGNDSLQAGSGHDLLDGGTGNDRLSGGLGHDLLMGGIGNDRLFGADGNDLLSGGLGNDIVRGDRDNDLVIGGFGEDAVQGNGGRDTVIGASAENEDDEAALLAVLAEWNEFGTYAGLGAVTDDGDQDGLAGGASPDEIYVALGDDVLEPDSDDTIVSI